MAEGGYEDTGPLVLDNQEEYDDGMSSVGDLGISQTPTVYEGEQAETSFGGAEPSALKTKLIYDDVDDFYKDLIQKIKDETGEENYTRV